MTLGGFMYPPTYYSYVVEHERLVPNANSKLFDNVFIPILTRYPFNPEYKHNNKPFSNTYLLCGLRIIQMIKSYTNYYKDNYNEISTSQIVKTLKKYFGYSHEIVIAMIEEYSEYGILKLTDNNYITPNMYDTKISPTPNFHFLYSSDEHNIFCDVAYLNLCGMRTLVSTKLLQDQSPLFIASEFREGHPITNWIVTKIINSVSMLKLIKSVNHVEILKIDEIIKSGQNDDKIFPHNLLSGNFINNLENQILMQIKTIVDGILEKDLTRPIEMLNKEIENYILKQNMCRRVHKKDIL